MFVTGSKSLAASSIRCGMSILYYARESALAYWDARAWERAVRRARPPAGGYGQMTGMTLLWRPRRICPPVTLNRAAPFGIGFHVPPDNRIFPTQRGENLHRGGQGNRG